MAKGVRNDMKKYDIQAHITMEKNDRKRKLRA